MYAYAATSGEAKTFTYNLGTYYMYAYAATSGKAKVKTLLLYAQDLYTILYACNSPKLCKSIRTRGGKVIAFTQINRLCYTYKRNNHWYRLPNIT